MNEAYERTIDAGEGNQLIVNNTMCNATVPLRPAVLRFIPEPPGSSRFMDRDVPGENDVFLPKNLEGRPSRPSRTGSTPEHPGSSR